MHNYINSGYAGTAYIAFKRWRGERGSETALDQCNSNKKTWSSQKCQQENEVVHYLLWEGGRGRKPNQNCHRERRGGWNSGRNDLGDGTSASERLCCKYSIQNGNITFGPWGENLITITSGGPLSDEIWTSLSNWRAWDLSENLQYRPFYFVF